MSLNAWQSDFGAWLREADPAQAARLGLADPRGLAVYQTNYRGQLMAALEDIFPHTHGWLGDAAFHATAAAHVEACPPSGWTLDGWPCGFAAHLAALYPQDAEVAELAALEWALSETFAAPDAPLLGPADLAEVDWDTASLRLIPAARLLPMASNAPAIWSALEAGDTPPAPAPTPHLLLVWRRDFLCHWREADPDEAALLPSLHKGLPFAEVCEQLAAAHGEQAGIAAAGALLARWASEGLLRAPQAIPRAK